MTGIHSQLGELTAEERELLELLLQQEGVDVARSLAIPRRPTTATIPLTYSQRRLWLIDLLAASHGMPSPNSNPAGWRIAGPLQPALLERSVQALIDRHEILRTTFTTDAGEPVQVVAPPAPYALPVVDLRDRPWPEREEHARHLAAAEARQPLDLARGPLLRARLLRLDDEDFIFLLTTHYMVADGLSEAILLRDLGTLYDTIANGRLSPLPDLPIQYADYALWQQQALRGDDRSRQLAYWKEHLRGSPAQLALPFDHPRPTVPTFRGASRSLNLPATLSPSLRALSSREGVTPYMVFLAAFQVLLHCYTRQDDIVVGTMVSARSRTETEALLGNFANNLFLRSRFSGNPTFRQVLKQVGEVAISAFAHQELPAEDLVTELHRDPSIGYAPLLQVIFVLHEHAAAQDLNFEGLTLHKASVPKETAIFDLYLRIVTEDGTFSGSIDYSTDVFDAATIDQMSSDFQTVLHHLVTDSNQPLDTLSQVITIRRAAPANGLAQSAVPIAAQRTMALPPRTELERTISAVWQEVLHQDMVGVDENVFDLGGRSFHLTLVSSRLQEILARPVPVMTFFEYPTVRALAVYLGQDEQRDTVRQADTSRAASRLASRMRRAQRRHDQPPVEPGGGELDE